MSDQRTVTPQPSWFSRFVKFVIRFVFAVVAGLLLGAILYVGAYALYNNYVQSVQINAQRINDIQSRQFQSDQQSQQRLEGLTSRLQTLESAGDSQKVALDDLLARLDTLESGQAEQVSILEALETQQAAIEQLQTDATELQRTYRLLQVEMQNLSQTVASGDERLLALESQLEGQPAQFAALQQGLQLVQVVEFLSRSRMFLIQNNPALAQQDIQTGREMLQAIQNTAPEEQAEDFDAMIAQLDSALASLPDRPVVAADNIEGVWTLLIQWLSETPPDAASATPSP